MAIDILNGAWSCGAILSLLFLRTIQRPVALTACAITAVSLSKE
jgi:hypothetical protein